MSVYAGPNTIENSLLLSLDAANIRSYPGSGTTVTDTISGFAPTLRDASYYTFNSDKTFTFTRTTAPTAKDGGGIVGVPTGNLTVGNFLYNNHTWEIWFKINDITAGNYDGTEAASVLAVFDGYHQGFYYTGGNVLYLVWDNTTSATQYNACYWSLGTSSGQILQGNWYQLVVTNNNKTFTPYVNGVPLGTGSTLTTFAWNSLYTGGNLCIGKANDAAAGTGSYNYFSKSTFGSMKMYNRALSAAEVSQNFNALRGRYGI